MSLATAAEALKTRIADVTKVSAYDLDEVPTAPPSRYVEVYLARRFGGNERMAGRQSNDGRRLSTRVIVKRDSIAAIDNGRLIEDRLHTAFESRVDLDGERVRVTYETGGGVFEQDGEWFVGRLIDWTFVI